MYEQDLALDNLQGLIYYKTQLTMKAWMKMMANQHLSTGKLT